MKQILFFPEFMMFTLLLHRFHILRWFAYFVPLAHNGKILEQIAIFFSKSPPFLLRVTLIWYQSITQNPSVERQANMI
jgi:hypothetical protein